MTCRPYVMPSLTIETDDTRTEEPLPAAAPALRLSGVGQLPIAEEHAWRQLLEDDPDSVVDLLPELVRLRSDAQILRLVESDGKWRTMAVLLTSPIRVGQHLLPGRPTHLDGMQLAGHQLVSCDHYADSRRVVAALASELVDRRCELLAVEDVVFTSALWDALHELKEQGFFVCSPLSAQPHRYLVLPESRESFWSTFSSKSRATTRRRRRKLNASIRRYTEPEEVDEFLEHGHAISLKSWQWLRCRSPLAVGDPSRERCRKLAEEGLWRSYILWSGDEPIAFASGWQANGTYVGEQAGYDLAFSRCGPGRLLLSALIDDLYDDRTPRLLDFGPGDMPYKAEFANSHTTTATIWVLPPGLRSWGIVQSLRLKQFAFRVIRSVLNRTGMYATARCLKRRMTLGHGPSR